MEFMWESLFTCVECLKTLYKGTAMIILWALANMFNIDLGVTVPCQD